MSIRLARAAYLNWFGLRLILSAAIGPKSPQRPTLIAVASAIFATLPNDAGYGGAKGVPEHGRERITLPGALLPTHLKAQASP